MESKNHLEPQTSLATANTLQYLFHWYSCWAQLGLNVTVWWCFIVEPCSNHPLLRLVHRMQVKAVIWWISRSQWKIGKIAAVLNVFKVVYHMIRVFQTSGFGVTHQIRVRFASPSTWVFGSSCGKLRQVACSCRSSWRWHGCRFAYLVLGDHPNFGAFVVDQLFHNWAERQGDAVVKFVTLVRMRDIFSTDWEIFSMARRLQPVLSFLESRLGLQYVAIACNCFESKCPGE